jgi:fatty acid-binding protein DegV
VPVAVVTDSTAYLPDGLAGERRIRVVPLTVRLGDRVGLDGVDLGPSQLTAALANRHASVSTSRPGPEAFTGCYRAALAAGATEIDSVHLSR